ncbi:hypothetical protein [Microcystis aeruginosa]|uniref:hypothetical protein n=1 Tax=Microcystis aeruginosa TaxID=1126 RepID=UPI00132FDCC2|nr:hypothetical protein [Microcystis aeruginosa]
MLKQFDICSGIGVGFPLDRRFPRVRNYGDATPLLAASPPTLSKRGDGTGGDCFPTIKRAIESFRPRYFCIASTDNILSIRRTGHQTLYLQHFLRQIARQTYDAEWLTVNSGYFSSPFFRRKLLFVVIAGGFIDGQPVTPWPEQIRDTVEERGRNQRGRTVKSPISRKHLLDSYGLDKPLGQPNSDPVSRHRRIALANALDPQMATIALARILYLDSL